MKLTKSEIGIRKQLSVLLMNKLKIMKSLFPVAKRNCAMLLKL